MSSTNAILNIAGYDEDAIADGPGLRFVLFAQGCPFRCPGCHNPQTHEFGVGTDYTVQELYDIITANPLQTGVTFSGGEPFAQAAPLAALGRMLKHRGYDIAVYSGTMFEVLVNSDKPGVRQLLEIADILVDGPFVRAMRDRLLMFRGSDNQRILDLPRSLAASAATWTDDDAWLILEEA